ncbi:MAG: AAA family ATPase [Paenibacillaceae bacterium]|nr:AAA family ATPase [Paenibacillaceae bacterium]
MSLHNLPDRLYGRDRELECIKEAFHWTTLGSTQMVCVSGPSGIGKTALIQEATRQIALGQAYIISGKFEPLQQDHAKSPLIAAFRELIELLLSEDKISLDRWRGSIIRALGAGAAVISEVIPEIERIIGQPAPVEPLPLEESIERFQFVFRRFIQVFCHQKHPLLLFMDDLQWADEASWRIIRSFMTDPHSQSLLLIGAIRDTDNAQASRIKEEAAAIAASGVAVQSLPLQPLASAHLTRMVKDTMRVKESNAAEIAHALLLKSEGNPLLFRRWLQRSLEEETLRFDETTDHWVWHWNDNHLAGDLADADLLLTYMTDSINRLPPDTRQAVLEASCLGGEIELELLSSWRKEVTDQTLLVLQPAVRRQIIILLEASRIRFVHDRLQEAANALLDASMNESIHWHAGNYWLDHPDPFVRERHLFDSADHLNKGSRLARLPEDGERLVQANASAGSKAKAATAYESAAVYFRAAAASMTRKMWERDFDFCFDMFVDLLECDYMNGWLPSADDMLAAILDKARNAYERMRVQQIEIKRLLHTEKMMEGIALGLQCLRDLGIHVSPTPGKEKLFVERLVTGLQLRRKVGRINSGRSVSNPAISAALQVLTLLSGSAFLCDKPLFRALTFKCVRLSLRYGSFSQAAAVFGSFGGILNHASGERKLARAALSEGVKIAETFHQPSVLCRAYLTVGVMFFIMDDDHRDFRASFQKSIDYGLEAGDLFFAGHAVIMLLVHLHMTGKLEQIKSMLPEYKTMLADTHNEYLFPYWTMFDRWVLALTGNREEMNADPDDQELLSQIGSSAMKSHLLFQYGLGLLQEGYLLGERQLALRGAEIAGRHTLDAMHYLQLSEYELYYGLELLAGWPNSEPSVARIVADCRKKLRRSAKKCPEHIRHKALLLDAEYARVRGKYDAAGRLYDDAIREAKRSGYMHHAAMACECAGRLYLAQSRETIAKGYLLEAYTLYRQWGASRKTEQLSDRYADYGKESAWDDFVATSAGALSVPAGISERSVVPDAPDLSIVQQAFQSIAAESDQRTLIETLMRTIIEHAGAQRGCFVMEHAKCLTVELSVDSEGNMGRTRMPLERYDEACLPAIRYAANTGDTVLLEHASVAGRYARDPYVMSCQIQSMLALPLPFQNQLAAVLYLENNRLPAAFTLERLDMIRMLATQTVFLLKLFPQDDKQKPQADPAESEEADDAQSEAASALAAPMDPLTKRELEILQLMSLGLSNQEIANQLQIAVSTVKLHTNRIFSKMNVHRRAKAVLEGKRMKLLKD